MAEGAEVNGTNPAGQTALMLAALMGRTEVVPLLLNAGADTRLEDNHGLSALEWSKRRGFPDVTQLLTDARPLSKETPAEVGHREGESEVERTKSQEFGPAATAILKTLQARREAEALRFRTAAENNKQDAGADVQKEAHAKVTAPLSEPSLPIGELNQIGDSTIPEIKVEELEDDEVFFERTASLSSEPNVWTEALGPPDSPPSESIPTQRLESEHLPVAADVELEAAPLPSTGPLNPDDTLTITHSGPPAVPLETLRSIRVSPEPTGRAETSGPNTYSQTRPMSPFALGTKEPPPSSTSTFARPMLWMLVAGTLLVSAVITYLVTNRFSRSESAATPAAPTATAAVPGPVLEPPARVFSNLPVLAGAIVGAETSVPNAEYPDQARSKGVSGTVVVVVKVSRAGGVVIDAQALNGDRQLRTAAENAARKATFSGDKLSDNSKVVSGTITYSFGVTSGAAVANPDDDSPVIGGALAGAELSSPKAIYPENARGKGISGSVVVVVRVNRMGEVIAAHPLNGNVQLRTAAVKAARATTFSRSKLPNESKVTSGTITYNFKAAKAEPPASATAKATNSPAAIPPTKAPGSSKAIAATNLPVIGGDLVGKELKIPLPDYPPAARSKGISGAITILVRVNRQGKVISWRTLDGNKVFREEALKAAKKATFSPEKLGNITSVLGTITYNFKP